MRVTVMRGTFFCATVLSALVAVVAVVIVVVSIAVVVAAPLPTCFV